MITIKPIKHTSEWETLVRNARFSPMTQSNMYGQFYNSIKESFFIVGAYNSQNKLVGGSLVLTVHAKRGSHLFLPYGPIITKDTNYADALNQLVNFLSRYAKKHNYAFIRVCPFVEQEDKNAHFFENTHIFNNAPIHALAETTVILDIQNNPDDILARMNKNHRNLIRRCEREGVKISMHTDHTHLQEFHKLHDITAKRHKFVRFSNDYVEKEFTAFEKKQEAVVWYSHLPDGRLDASAVVYYHGNTASYRHGASLGLNRKIPTPYLIQWYAILEARKRRMSHYNFWGIAPDNAHKNHPFQGITHFKKGFGGTIHNLVPTKDIVIHKTKYRITYLIETLRKKKRRF